MKEVGITKFKTGGRANAKMKWIKILKQLKQELKRSKKK